MLKYKPARPVSSLLQLKILYSRSKLLMVLFTPVLHKLHQPHPGYNDLGTYFRTVLGITAIVFLILSILQPFNIGQRNIYNNPYITAAVYAGAAALVMTINALWLLVFPRWFKAERWTLAKELVVLAYQICSIAIVIWLINHYRGTLPPKDASFLKSLFLAATIGLLPYLLATFGRHNYLLRRNLKEVEALNNQLQKTSEQRAEAVEANRAGSVAIHIPGVAYTIALADFIYAEAQGNNLVIQYVKEGKMQTRKLRATLQEFGQSNSHIGPLFRCHRSFIINTGKILQVQGNAAGYQVLLHPDLPAVVVARSQVEAFKKRIAKTE